MHNMLGQEGSQIWTKHFSGFRLTFSLDDLRRSDNITLITAVFTPQVIFQIECIQNECQLIFMILDCGEKNYRTYPILSIFEHLAYIYNAM